MKRYVNNHYHKMITFMILLSFLVAPIIGEAEGSKGTISPPIGVEAIIPNNQVDKTKTYFDLLLKPGEKQQVSIKLTNFTTRKITVDVENNDAMTNDNGIVDYSQHEKNSDASLKYSFSEISQIAKEVTIPPQASVTTKLTINMPKNKFEGIIAGGIYIYEKDKAQETNVRGTISNKFVYSLGVQLRNEASLDKVKPTIELDKEKIIPIRSNGLNGIEVNLQNTSPNFIKELEIEAKIINNSDKYLSHEIKKTDLKMAPNSNFYFPLTWTDDEGPGITSGSYIVEVTAYSNSNKQKWEWKIPLTASTKKTKKKSKQAFITEPVKSHFFSISIAVCLVIVIGLVVIYFINSRKSHSTKDKRLKRK